MEIFINVTVITQILANVFLRTILNRNCVREKYVYQPRKGLDAKTFRLNAEGQT